MISEKTRELLTKAQSYQQQIQLLMAQKEAINAQLIELKKALEELRKTKETEVYRISGPILLKSKKPEVEKDLKEKENLLSGRLKTIETNEKSVKGKLDELREDISKTDIKGAR